METFLLQEIAKSLTLTHSRLQAIKTEKSYSQPGLSSFLLRDHQSIIEIHPDFYDPIGIQLERSFHEKEISDRIPTEVTHSYSTSNINSPRIILFLTLMFESYIRVGIKLKRWLHSKYHFT